MSQIRAFIAIPLSAQIIARLEDVQRKLRALPADVKWVRTESIHLTLKFLGNIEEDMVERISHAVQRGVQGFKPWSVGIRTLGTFPTMRDPRVVWVGLQDSTGQLVMMQERVEHELYQLGFERESRPFTPHLTLGRVRSPRGKQDLVCSLIDERETDLGVFEVHRVVLFKSDLQRSGAVYTELREFGLGG